MPWEAFKVEPTAQPDNVTRSFDEVLRENVRLRARVSELEAVLAQARTSENAVLPQASSIQGVSSAVSSAGSSAGFSTRVPPVPPMAVPIPRDVRSTSLIAEGLTAEQFVGRRVVPIVGAIAVLGAVGWLVQHAIEIGFFGMLPPAARFAMGIAIGVALLGVGEVIRRRVSSAAAVGLDAAGVGALLVSIALGVFSLELFNAQLGALLAGGAGLFGAAWSVRTRSAVVGLAALLGLFGLPTAFQVVGDDWLLGGLLLTTGLAAGLGMHALGGRAFTPIRFFAIAATIVLAPFWFASSGPAVAHSGMLFLWFAMVAAESALAAIRGRAARGNVVMLGLASFFAFIIQISAWSVPAFAADPRAWFPMIAGAMLLAQALFLRGFVFPVEEGESDVYGAAEDGGSLRASSDACARLTPVSLALGFALVLGGAVRFLPDIGEPVAVAFLSASAAWIARRERAVAFDVVAVGFAVVAMFGAWISLITSTFGASAGLSCTLPFGAICTLRLDQHILSAVLTAGVLLAATSLRAHRATDVLRTIAAAITWCVASFAWSPDLVVATAFALPAIVVGCIRDARRMLVVATLAVLALGGVVWLGMLVDGGFGRNASRSAATIEFAAWSLPVLAVGAILAVNHRALGGARQPLTTLASLFVGAGISLLGAAVGAARGYGMGDVLLAGMLALCVAATILMLVGNTLGRREFVDGGVLGAWLAITMGSFAGVGRIFEQTADHSTSVVLAFASVLAAGVAAVVAWRALARASQGGSRMTALSVVMLAVGIVPLGAILVAALVGRPMAAAVAAAWMVVAGVVELTIGFRAGIAALRWAGLASCLLLIARLYLVDLASTPIFVRVVLLFVTGLILVGVGIIYTRRLVSGVGQVHASTTAVGPDA